MLRNHDTQCVILGCAGPLNSWRRFLIRAALGVSLALLLLAAPLLAASPVTGDPVKEAPRGAKAAAVSKSLAALGDSSTLAANQIDRLLNEDFGAPAEGLAGLANDYTYLRRLSLDLIGQPPSPKEVLEFAQTSDGEKRHKKIQELLALPEYGKNWASYWRDVIMYRKSEDRAMLAARSLEDFLTTALNKNRSWDKIAEAFVTATGDVREHGETAIIMAQAGRPEETVAELSRIFLGIQIQCAQCHNHPTDAWTREQFHQLAAFFPRVALRPVRDDQQRSFEVVGVDFMRPRRKADDNGRYLPKLEHYMSDLQDPTAQGTLTTPTFFVSGKSLPLGSSDVKRRETLAEWMTNPTNNPWFAKSLVNRMWTELTGEGFYERVDDLGPERKARAPKTLEYLSNQFVANKHDVKWLMETITQTKAYQSASRSHEEGKEIDLRQPRPRRLRSDQVFQSLAMVLDIPMAQKPDSLSGDEMKPARYRRDPRFLFATVFGFDPSEAREDITGSVPQSLMLMNSPLISGMLRRGRFAGDAAWMNISGSEQDVVEGLYLRFLSRPPETQELKTAIRFLHKAENRKQGSEDIAWALINSTEFVHAL